MLCALVMQQHCQSLHLISLVTMHMDNNSYFFHIDQLVKQSAQGKDHPILVIPRFPTDEYIKCTAPLHRNESHLFISVIKAHRKVSEDSISRWIQNVMKAAGIDTAVSKPQST